MTERDPRELLRRPLVVAPMGGGPSTPELVIAASAAGALGFLAGGYKSADAMRQEIDEVRRATQQPFGVNLFVPGAPSADRAALSQYVKRLEADASRLRCEIGEPTWDDDGWTTKLAHLLESPPAVVSFAFGCPDRSVIEALHQAGAQVWITVTMQREAVLAASGSADAICVQSFEAGAHRGTFADSPVPQHERALASLVREIAKSTDLPIIAAGGIMEFADVREVLSAGAVAAQCGTAFLRCPESGAHPLYKEALADPRFVETQVTRAFSGRAARGLVNTFMTEHFDAPAAYPEINNATRPLRAAAAALGETQSMSLWAGCGWKAAIDRPAGEIVDLLCGA